MSVTAIQAGLEACLDTVSGLSVLDDAPKTVRDFPAVIPYLAGIEQVEFETGLVTDNRWRFAVVLCVKSERSMGAAMIAHAGTLESILSALRDDPTLGGSCDYIEVIDGGDPEPIEDTSLPYVVKRLYVIARTTES